MLYDIYDTKTTGFTNENAPPEDESQPWLLQLGARLVSGPKLDKIEREMDLIINWPQLTEIPAGASKVHGITLARMRKEGRPPLEVLQQFDEEFAVPADSQCAFNLNFDEIVLLAAYHRVGGTGKRFRASGKICIMQSATPVLKLPRVKSTAGGYKPPSLMEAYKGLVDKKGFKDAHTALADAAAAHAVLQALAEQGAGLVYVRKELPSYEQARNRAAGAGQEQRQAGAQPGRAAGAEGFDFAWLEALLTKAKVDRGGVLDDFQRDFAADFRERFEKYGNRTNVSPKQLAVLRRIDDRLEGREEQRR